MTNLNNLVYMCKEIFDENSEPTQIGTVYIYSITVLNN